MILFTPVYLLCLCEEKPVTEDERGRQDQERKGDVKD